MAVFLAMSDRTPMKRATLAQAAEDRTSRSFGGERHCRRAHGGHRTHRRKRASSAPIASGSTATTFACVVSQPPSPRTYAPTLGRARGALARSSTTSTALPPKAASTVQTTQPSNSGALAPGHGARPGAPRQPRRRRAVRPRSRRRHLSAIDSPWTQGDALCDLRGRPSNAGGRREDALATLQEALTLYEQQADRACARRTRESTRGAPSSEGLKPRLPRRHSGTLAQRSVRRS